MTAGSGVTVLSRYWGHGSAARPALPGMCPVRPSRPSLSPLRGSQRGAREGLARARRADLCARVRARGHVSSQIRRIRET